MPQLLAIILIIALIGYALKLLVVAFIVLLIMGLIWRQKETMGAFLFLFIIGMIGKFPWIALAIAIAGAIAAYFNSKAKIEADKPSSALMKKEQPVEHSD